MLFTLDNVKYLFDKYDIRKNVAGEFFIVDRASKQPVIIDASDPNQKHLVDWVKFAHAWYLARQNNRSNSSLDRGITPEKYARTFDEQAQAIYDYIMAVSVKSIQESGTFPHHDTLAEEVKEATKDPHASLTIYGLYANPNRELSFKKWVIDATFSKNKVPQETNLNSR